MLWALVLFMLATLGTLVAPTAGWFLAFRMMQAAVGAGMVLSRAVVRDMVAGDAAASRIGYVTMGMSVIPMLAPGILAGGLLAFTLSIDDFVISFFVAGPGSTTLPIKIYSMIKYGAPPLINALSTILLVITFSCVIASQYMSNRDRRTA